jgi:hypothetical protein
MVVIRFTADGQGAGLLWFPDEDTCDLAQLDGRGPDMAAFK